MVFTCTILNLYFTGIMYAHVNKIIFPLLDLANTIFFQFLCCRCRQKSAFGFFVILFFVSCSLTIWQEKFFLSTPKISLKGVFVKVREIVNILWSYKKNMQNFFNLMLKAYYISHTKRKLKIFYPQICTSISRQNWASFEKWTNILLAKFHKYSRTIMLN